MATYDETALVKLGGLKTAVQKIKTEIDGVKQTAAADAFKSVTVSGNQIKFFKSTDGTGTAAATVDFPSELFLDGTKTSFVANFSFNTQLYPGASDPNMNGKPVLVLAVKTTGATESYSYSFLDMAKLVDTYTAKAGDTAKILNISGYEIEFKVSAESGNAILVKNDGLYVTTAEKANKPSSSTAGHVATLDNSGNLTDGGSAIATATEIDNMLKDVFGE